MPRNAQHPRQALQQVDQLEPVTLGRCRRREGGGELLEVLGGWWPPGGAEPRRDHMGLWALAGFTIVREEEEQRSQVGGW